jgi:hypothetical protein
MSKSVFIDIINATTQSKARKSSRIKEWLGVDSVSQSVLIKLGNQLENYFNALIGSNSLKSKLPKKGKNTGVYWNDEFHQVDLIACVDGVIKVRELKTNPDLDRGKRRDTVNKEQCISQGLSTLFNEPIHSRIVCPFIESKYISGLGEVEGLGDFISEFNLPITVEEFTLMGNDPDVHYALGLN